MSTCVTEYTFAWKRFWKELHIQTEAYTLLNKDKGIYLVISSMSLHGSAA